MIEDNAAVRRGYSDIYWDRLIEPVGRPRDLNFDESRCLYRLRLRHDIACESMCCKSSGMNGDALGESGLRRIGCA